MKKSMVFYFVMVLALGAAAQDKNCLKDIGDKMCLVSAEGKYGIVNKKGDYIVPVYFDSIEVYSFGFIVRQTGKYGVFDRKGKIIVPIEFSGVRCVGDCDKELIIEISDIGMKSIYVTKKMDVISGFKKVTPMLCVSTYEISIRDWFMYVQNVKENGYNYNYGYLETLPDTGKVEEKLLPAYRAFIKGANAENITGFPDVKFNLGYLGTRRIYAYYDNALSDKNLEDMMDFPVTGITYKQVQRYTEWLTTIYRNEVNKESNLDYEIRFRLPRMEEWEKIAAGGLAERFRKSKCFDSLDTDGNMRFVYNASSATKNYDNYTKVNFGKGSTKIDFSWPDYNGIYGIYGNVAEMLWENGLAKGGSYFHPAKSSSWDKTMQYESAQPWLGFRVVAEFKALK